MKKECLDCLWFGKECEHPGECDPWPSEDRADEEYYKEILHENAEEYMQIVREQDE